MAPQFIVGKRSDKGGAVIAVNKEAIELVDVGGNLLLNRSRISEHGYSCIPLTGVDLRAAFLAAAPPQPVQHPPDYIAIPLPSSATSGNSKRVIRVRDIFKIEPVVSEGVVTGSAVHMGYGDLAVHELRTPLTPSAIRSMIGERDPPSGKIYSATPSGWLFFSSGGNRARAICYNLGRAVILEPVDSGRGTSVRFETGAASKSDMTFPFPFLDLLKGLSITIPKEIHRALSTSASTAYGPKLSIP